MSEARLARGILLAHGAMAEGIIDAVRNITGAEADVLVPLSNKGLSPQTLAEEVRRRVGDGPTILFTDLQSGSCGMAARLIARDLPNLVVLSGVNLPILLEFVMLRHLPVDELVPRLLAKGRAGMGCAPETLEKNVDRAVSGG
jgi:mannose/fructose-specific phosphotransferase system component IIA